LGNKIKKMSIIAGPCAQWLCGKKRASTLGPLEKRGPGTWLERGVKREFTKKKKKKKKKCSIIRNCVD